MVSVCYVFYYVLLFVSQFEVNSLFLLRKGLFLLNGVQWDNVGVPCIVSQVKCYGKHMVNKIIADYLKAGKRIVIPQFGAFLHRDTDGGVVLSPS